MKTKNGARSIISMILVACMLATTLIVTSITAFAETAEKVKIGTTEYTSLTEAINAVKGGTDAAVIELLTDCEITDTNLGTFTNSVTITGDYKVKMSNVILSIASTGKLILDGSEVEYVGSNKFGINTNINMSSEAEFSLVNGAAFYAHDGTERPVMMFYTAENAVINVSGESSFKCENFAYTVLMNEGGLAKINVTEGSEFIVDTTTSSNGLTSFDINVDNSTFQVVNCKNQGIVKSNLTLTNGATADASNNSYGMNLYSINTVTVNDGTTLTVNNNFCGVYSQSGKVNVESGGTVICNNNRSKAFHIFGPGSLNVAAGGNLEVRENGVAWKNTDTNALYVDKAAIVVGVYRSGTSFILRYTNSSVNFDDEANVNISDNYNRGISSFGTVNLGAGTIITNNGCLAAGETESDRRVETGGGIYNMGTLNMSTGAQVHNNNAYEAGDDIYNAHYPVPQVAAYGQAATTAIGKMTLVPASTFGAKLNDCGHDITGWYYDGLNNANATERWNTADCSATDPVFISEYSVLADDVNNVALKAAHGVVPTIIIDDTTPLAPVVPPVTSNDEPKEQTVIKDETPLADIPETEDGNLVIATVSMFVISAAAGVAVVKSKKKIDE